MPLPNSLHGSEYYQGLDVLRVEAFKQSEVSDSRIYLGRLVIGSVSAQWDSESGGTTCLTDTGIRVGEIALFNSHPTKMTIFSHGDPNGIKVTTFRIGPDDVEVYRHTMMASGSLLKILQAEMHRCSNTPVPTPDELALLYTEMERGASGKYAAKP